MLTSQTRPNGSTVPAQLRAWSTPFPDYAPTDITPPELCAEGIAASVAQGWAEPETTPLAVDFAARQYLALVPYRVVNGRPRNPSGRTGRVGRDLGRWGENSAADAIVVADTPHGRFVLLIRRDDCGRWALPGGMVEPGEFVLTAAVRELAEETGIDLHGATGEVVFRGYVDDPRNTDEAWVCTAALLYRVTACLPAVGADDAAEARWWPFDSPAALTVALSTCGERLYRAHGPLLAAAHERLTAAGPHRHRSTDDARRNTL